MTKYPKQILQIIQTSRDHLTAEQIFQELKQIYPAVVRATVYNNLHKLWESGAIRKVVLEGQPDRYDRLERHDHLVCKECGRLSDVTLSDLTRQLEEQLGMPILSYDLKMTYLCEACKNKQKEERT
ncbi:transcriptional repressor [Pseudoflavonifractor sp. An85]|uniref:Fur family transcriptional regulator n=1 Tax=Pseudoflavonifractor sp. An85 TaxID=1965661 RepID=UPI000B3A0DC6|nr:transcriptional repressor [Pseudoflavonifractor sp. An85]OUN23058.1 transcriptional repressor [Pseudoflavonifractor sp. An85]